MNHLLVSILAVAAMSAAQPMNVMFILTDDLGWAGTTLYGYTIL